MYFLLHKILITYIITCLFIFKFYCYCRCSTEHLYIILYIYKGVSICYTVYYIQYVYCFPWQKKWNPIIRDYHLLWNFCLLPLLDCDLSWTHPFVLVIGWFTNQLSACSSQPMGNTKTRNPCCSSKNTVRKKMCLISSSR